MSHNPLIFILREGIFFSFLLTHASPIIFSHKFIFCVKRCLWEKSSYIKILSNCVLVVGSFGVFFSNRTEFNQIDGEYRISPHGFFCRRHSTQPEIPKFLGPGPKSEKIFWLNLNLITWFLLLINKLHSAQHHALSENVVLSRTASCSALCTIRRS
jgi:hypothetical protein